MKIKVDEETSQAITQLCDIALKTGGLQNIEGVMEVMNSIELIVQENKEEGEKGEEGG